MTQGWHTLIIRYREGGAQLDALEITDRSHAAYKPGWGAPCGAQTVTPTPSPTSVVGATATSTLTPTLGAPMATPTVTATSVSGEVHIRLEAEGGYPLRGLERAG